MTLERARLTRLPVAATLDDYTEAASELEGVLRGLPGVVAIYRTGSVLAPGISDLDRVVVVESDAKLADLWPRLSPRTRYLAMHSPFVVDRETLVRHRWFANLEPFERVWGEAVEVDEPPAPEYAHLLVAAEALVVAALKLIKQQSTGVVKVRALLCELNNLRRDLALAAIDRVEAPSAWELADRVTRLRQAWWGLYPSQRATELRAVLARARPAVHEALGAVPATDSTTRKPLQLACEWSGVALVGENGRPNWNDRSPLRFLPARVSQRVWHLRRHEVSIPSAALALIAGSQATDDRFRKERRGLVQRYLEFAAKCAPAYSRLGAAGVFVNA